jgi:hypothetical protein
MACLVARLGTFCADNQSHTYPDQAVRTNAESTFACGGGRDGRWSLQWERAHCSSVSTEWIFLGVNKSINTSSIWSDKSNTGLSINTQFKMTIQAVRKLSTPGKSDIRECKDWGWQRSGSLEGKVEFLVVFNLFYESGSLHLVKNLLTRLSLFDQIRVGTLE